MDKYEVTNTQYRNFVQATGHRKPSTWNDDDFNMANQPVVGVSWSDAVSYAKWAGKRLPTGKEWEWAARGGLKDKLYSWGDDEGLARDYSNFEGIGGRDKWNETAPVGSFKANDYGLHDMAGNVFEWCADWYDRSLDHKVIRGGSWDHNSNALGVANRHGGRRVHGRLNRIGFRCVADLDISSDSSTTIESEPLPQVANQKIIEWQKDNSQMALIPAGSFEMGDSKNEPEGWMKRSRPVHRVELDAFYMDVREVTVGQFREFVNQSGYSYNRWNDVAKYSAGDEYPMVYVNWNDATAYASWAGKRLPTEAEWEYAARGGLVGKRYPWGDEINHDDANWGNTVSGKDKWRYCSPVGSFEANGYGLYDMAGNVWEWCQDWYGSDYYNNSPTKNPPGPDTGSKRVLRGGSWDSSTFNLRVANRLNYFPTYRYLDYGFRCVSGSN